MKHDEPSIKQYYVKVEREEGKLDILRGLYKTWDINRSVIFANTKQKVRGSVFLLGKPYFCYKFP